MNENLKLEWTALEYEDKERSKDWFWALGVIVVTSSIASIIFANYFFAALIIIGGAMLGYFATQKPSTISYELNARGLKAGTRLFPYETIKSFWVQEIRPTIFIKSERFFMPIISIPIEGNMIAEVHEIFSAQGIPEEEMKEHISDKIMDTLGF
ncbi:MAG: hypothetical protein KBC06_01805 [Candidatus Pacebacteria bacterium]|nr:hypothetical protein [Candidatus Paceibacterota bacterium]